MAAAVQPEAAIKKLKDIKNIYSEAA